MRWPCGGPALSMRYMGPANSGSHYVVAKWWVPL
jgi:hypothetical protein